MSYQEDFGKCEQCGESDCDCENVAKPLSEHPLKNEVYEKLRSGEIVAS